MGRLFCLKNRVFLSVLSSLIITGILVPYFSVFAAACSMTEDGNGDIIIAANCEIAAGTYTITRDFIINSGVTVTAQANTGTGTGVIINAGRNITISSTAVLTADAQGFTQELGPGAGNNTIDDNAGSGAGHGGEGGDAGFPLNGTGPTYGSVIAPVTIGSGGGDDEFAGNQGGAGGGAIKLSATAGTVTISGTVRANGQNGVGTGDGGGGSGGSVWINASTIAGTGTIQANGGTALVTDGGGGGGGGRVAVTYTSGNPLSYTLQAFGGTGGNQVNFTGDDGGAGSIFLKSNAAANGDLIIDNNNHNDSAPTTPVTVATQTYDNVTVRNGADYKIPSGFTLAIASGGAFTGGGTQQSSLAVLTGGVFTPPAGTTAITGIDISGAGSIDNISSLTLSDSRFTFIGAFTATLSTLTLASGADWEQSPATAEPDDLIVQSGGIWTQNHANTITFNSVTVQSGGTITHCDNSAARTCVIDIAAATVDIQSGGSVNLDGKGFNTNQGPGKGSTGSNAGGGGAYGGNGGNGGVGNGPGGAPYGSVTAPVDLGSGGASDETGVGTSGGGFAKLAVSGTFTNNGTISANGVNVVTSSDAGGGSGGGFDVTAGTVAGTGTMRATGGAGEPTNGGGGGSGGRIAIKYTSGNPLSYTLQAFGGAGGLQSGFSGEDGGAGTIYLKSAAQSNGDLIVKNNNHDNSAFTTQIAPSTQTYDNITVADGAEYRVASTFTLALASGGTSTGGGTVRGFIQNDLGGTFDVGAATFTLGNNSKVVNNGAVVPVTSLTIASGAIFIHNTSTGTFGATLSDLTVASTGTFSTSQSTMLSVTSTVTVQSGGTLTHEANTSAETHKLHISTANIDIQTGGTVTANSKGFSSSNGTGQGTDGSNAGGAGHGGDGGNAATGTAGGVTYGDSRQPTTLGSGGGADTSPTAAGGAGGGAIRLVASGTMTVAGTISANGANGSASDAGGGSGGSVWLDSSTVTGAGAITANGGAGLPTTPSTLGGGGGGGGRIAVTFNTNTSSGARQAFGGNRGGTTSSPGAAGGAGTIFTDDKDDALANGDLLVDNNNNAGIAASSETTQVTTASQTYDNLTIRNGARYVIPATMSLTVTPGGTFTGGGATQPILTVASTGTFTLPNATQTVTGIDILNNGTVGMVTDLTLSDSVFTHNGTFALTVTNLSFLTTASTFIHNGTNFNDQDLIVGNSGTFVLQTAAAFSINSLLVQSTGIYEHRRLGAATITTVTVNSGGTMTHTANTTSKIYEFHVSSSSIDIQTGGTVTANSKGFSSSNGTGQGTDGSNAGGAGHGGDGGNAATGTAGGVTYGDPRQPTTLGSGGGADTSPTAAGGAGGGAIRLEATGTITVAGSIVANGANGTASDAGGGSGGSVWLDASTVTGAGAVTANGGAGLPTTPSTLGGGGGGGGRIAITFNTNTASGARQAFGGNRGGTTSSPGAAGGAGTVFTDDKNDALANGDLLVDNNNNNAGIAASSETTQVTTASQTYDNLTIRNGARYVIPATMSLTVSPSGTFTGGGATQPLLTVASTGTFTLPNATQTVTGIDILNNGTVGTVTDLTLSDSVFTHNGTFALTVTNLSFLTTASTFIHNGTNFNDQDLIVNNSGTFVLQTAAAFSINSLLVQSTGIYEHRRLGAATITTVTVNSGGTMTHTANTTSKIYELHISSSSIDIQSGGTVTASSKGFSSTSGTGQGTDGSNPGGAGHGGDGGNGHSGTAGGVTYGDPRQPTTLGSGGGADTSPTAAGGAGGGAIRLEATGTITVAGSIVASGANGSASDAGGGSGGSIWLDANTITGAGAVTANGGAGQPTGVSSLGGGGGGGGRIAITFNTNTASGTRQAFGGNRGGTTGTSVAGAGGAGTVFFDDKDDALANGDLIVDNNNNAGIAASSETTQVTTTFQTYDNLTIRNGSRYVIPATMTLVIASGGTLTGGGATQPLLTINSTGTFNPNQASFTPTSLSITNSGTIASVTSLTLNDSTFTHNGTFSALLTSLTLQSTGTFIMQTISGLNLSTMTAQSGGTFEQRMIGAVTIGTVTVESGGNLTHTANTTTKTSELNISAVNIDVQASGTVNAGAKGFSASNGTGPGTDGTTAGGGGHCAAGGNSSAGVLGGAAYGSATSPTTLGSGGGNDTSPAVNGGAGGGTIKFDVSGTLTVNGVISANGANGNGSESGGGAGGAIWLAVGTWAGNSSITANGGNGSGTTAGGGGGGAGYARVEYVSKTFSGTMTSAGGAKGGSGAAQPGGNCTPTEVSGNNPTPSTTSISPTTKNAGDATFTLTVNGANFIASSVVRFNGSDRATTFVNANQVTAQILASDISTGGSYAITVFNPGPGGGTSNAQTLNVNNPVPTTTSISPTTKAVGDAEFSMTVNGTNFVTNSVVRFAGSDRSTTFINGTQLTAVIPETDMTATGTFAITVFNPAPGGGTSNSQTFTVNNPVPVTTDIDPVAKDVGDSAFTMTVNGSRFLSTSVVRFQGSDRTTTFIDDAQLTAEIPASDMNTAGTFNITVFNPTPGGGTSNAQTFTVSAVDSPLPVTTSISPSTRNVGGDAFVLTVNGSDFVAASVVRFEGSDRTTTFVNSGQLNATIPSSDLLVAGAFEITVFNPAPGGGLSNAQTLTVSSEAPTTGNKVTLSRLKVGVVATVDVAFTLSSTLSSPLVVTFPAGFTVLSAATGGSGCLSNFTFTSSTLSAEKDNCTGPIIMSGATVQNPATPGGYFISWVNDDPGGAYVFITSDDQANVSASITPTITFNVGSQAAATACDGTFAGNGGSVPLGALTVGSVATSDVASIPHICARVTTDASSGAAVSVRSANAALASVAVPADTIASSTATLTPGTAGYGLCAGSGGSDTGKTDPAGGPPSAAPARAAPFNGSCGTGSHAVGGLTTSFQNIWTVAAPSLNAFARIYVKASISSSTAAHIDYTDTLTFIVTGTY